MADDATRDDEPTRREYVKYGGAVVTGGLLAGCAGGGDGDAGSTPTATDANTPMDAEPAAEDRGEATPTGTEPSPDAATPTEEDTPTATPEDTGYSVTMEPVGTVEFDDVPEKWFPFTADYADIGVALGQADGLSGIGLRARYPTYYYEELPGVSVEKEDLTQLWQEGVDKELFYELDADVHVIDPNFVINRLQWSQGDVDEIRENVAPFVGNTGFTRVYGWHDYRHYGMYEAFEILAELFQERGRYEAFASYHDEVLESVQSRLPDESPSVVVLVPGGLPPEKFWPSLIDDGTTSKHWRDLGVTDALGEHGVRDSQVSGESIDFELLLEIDPDVLAIRADPFVFGKDDISEQFFEENIRSPLESDEVASELTAVQNGRVFNAGQTYQGPIIHLFQLERAARGVYPDEFGEEEELFDRERVAEIVNGDV